MFSRRRGTTLEVDLQPGKPPILSAPDPGAKTADVARWAADNRDAVRALVAEHGSVQIRGLQLRDSADAAAVAGALTSRLMTEREAFATRDAHPGGIYSSSAWPPSQQMCMHHELSYRLRFPGMMVFACLAPATEGGTIALADSPTVLDRLPADLVERAERDGWMLTRSYTDEIGLSVAEAFGTGDRAAIESYCRANDIDFAWQPDGGLRTTQRRPAVVNHPVTGERCWFNQIAFLNEWTLNPEVREFLVDMYGPDGLPFNTRFGNGDPVAEDVVTTINDVYEQCARRESLQAGDVVVVDNIRTAHSRDPYEGPREVLVGLGDETGLADL